MAFVADAEGVGTTAVVASDARRRSAPASDRRRGGAPRRRCRTRSTGSTYPRCGGTSTTRDDLAEALAARCRPRTASVDHALAGLGHSACPRLAACRPRSPRSTRTPRDGRVLLDDGVELPFAAEALAGSRLRLLRPGQRVRLETAGDGAGRGVVGLQILTLA